MKPLFSQLHTLIPIQLLSIVPANPIERPRNSSGPVEFGSPHHEVVSL
jgi:hypothetical protein